MIARGQIGRRWWTCLKLWWVVALLSSAALAEDADLTALEGCGCLGDVHLAYRKAEQEFVLRAQYMPAADPATPYSVWVQSTAGSDEFYPVGDMVLIDTGAAGGGWRLELRGTGEAPLALAVAELSELSGRLVQVRDFASTNVVLWGALPLAIPSGKPTGDVWTGQLDLQRPEGREKATGFVALNKTGSHQSFTVHARKLDWGPGWANWDRVFATLIETGVDSGEFQLVGYLKRQLKVSNNYDYKLFWELKLWSANGAPPGLGAEDLAELAGRRVRVRDDLEQTWLETGLPELALKGTLHSTKWRVTLSPAGEPPLAPAATGKVRIVFDPKRGRSRCDLRTRRLTASAAYAIYIEDGPGLGTFTHFAPLADRAQFRCDTRDGARLPFGVPRIIDLTGRVIEIRDNDETAMLRGQLP